jgi:enhancing lycopene biosynthesis protein 2
MANRKRIGVVLSGCGHRDGSEVHEATLTLLAISAAGAEAICFAPQGDQLFVRNHLTGEDDIEVRDVLVESARIARGSIRELSEARADDLDAMIMPGGQGAALNLSTFLVDGLSAKVNPELTRLVGEMFVAEKPIGAICIAPVTLGLALRTARVIATLTVGVSCGVSEEIERMGHDHVLCAVDDCVVDARNKIVTTPAYMVEGVGINDVWQGIGKLVSEIINMA